MPDQLRTLTGELTAHSHGDAAVRLSRARSDTSRQWAAIQAVRDLEECQCNDSRPLRDRLRAYADEISLMPFTLEFQGDMRLTETDFGRRGIMPPVVRLKAASGTLVLSLLRSYCSQELALYYAINESEAFPDLLSRVPDYARGYWGDWRSALGGIAEYLWPRVIATPTEWGIIHELIRVDDAEREDREAERRRRRTEASGADHVADLTNTLNWRQIRREASARHVATSVYSAYTEYSHLLDEVQRTAPPTERNTTE